MVGAPSLPCHWSTSANLEVILTAVNPTPPTLQLLDLISMDQLQLPLLLSLAAGCTGKMNLSALTKLGTEHYIVKGKEKRAMDTGSTSKGGSKP